MSIELVVGSFPGKNKAGEVLEHLEQLAADRVLQLEHVAVVAKVVR